MVTFIKNRKDAEICRGCAFGRLHTNYDGLGKFSTDTYCVHPEQDMKDDFCLLNLYKMKEKGEPALYIYVGYGNVLHGSKEERSEYRMHQKDELYRKGVI